MKGDLISSAREPSGTLFPAEANLPRRILVVDDDRVLRQTNALVLLRAGYHVDTAEDGAVAWRELGESDYDLMITDNTMPHLTGMELLNKLHGSRMALPFIMATEKMPEAEFAQYPWLRPAATLLKPYTVEELLGVVKEVLCETNGAAAGSRVPRGLDLRADQIPQTEKPWGLRLQPSMNRPHRILVVHDEPDLRRLNTEMLESHGYEVDSAEDGQAGWAALHATRHAPESYALLITDHEMPGWSGLALVKKVRAAHLALPVIMATGRLSTTDLMNRYPWLHPAVALGKPYSIGEFLRSVEAVLHTTTRACAEISPPPDRRSDGGLQPGCSP